MKVFRGPIFVVAAVLASFNGLASAAEPQFRVVPQSGPARLNEDYRIVYEVTWTGDIESYSVNTPELESLDWGSFRVVESRASSVDGTNVVSHAVVIRAAQEGDFMVPEVRIGIVDPAAETVWAAPSGTQQEPAKPLPILVLRAEPFRLHVVGASAISPLFTYGGGLTALTGSLLASILYVRNRRQRGLVTPDEATPLFATVHEALHTARQQRLDGSYYEYFTSLSRAAGMLPKSESSKALRSRLALLADDVGYRGRRPTEDEMEGGVREIERLLNAG